MGTKDTSTVHRGAAPLLPPGATTVLPDGPWVLTVRGPYDLTALVLDADGTVSGDADMVFFNAPRAPGVVLSAGAVTVDPRRLRRGARRVLLAAAAEDGVTPFGRLPPPALTLSAPGGEVARARATGLGPETVVQLAEVYEHRPASGAAHWKLRVLGAGHADGLAGLAREFGVQVDDPGPGAGTGAGPAPGAGPGPGAAPAWLDEVVALTNARRREHGLVPLTVEPRLVVAAQAHNDDMVARGYFAHEGPDGSSVADRVRRTGYVFSVVAENLAAGQRTPAEVVQGWMDSPGHRANLLHRDVRQIGVGYTEGGSYGTTWTQVVGTPL